MLTLLLSVTDPTGAGAVAAGQPARAAHPAAEVSPLAAAPAASCLIKAGQSMLISTCFYFRYTISDAFHIYFTKF